MSTPLIFEVEVAGRSGSVEVAAPHTGVTVSPDLQVIFAAVPVKGDPGPGSPFLIVTQEEFDALDPPDDETLYVVL